mgnify:CR=1 FL=1
MSWYVYIIESSDHSLYTGITTDLERRFQQHLTGKGAKYFFARKPVKIVFSESHINRSTASVREYEIKQFSRKQKEQLIQS